MKSTPSVFKLFLMLSMLGISSMRSLAQEVKVDELAPDISQLTTAETILQKACNFLKEHQSFSVEMDITYDNVLSTGEKFQFSAVQKVKINKPDHIFSEYIGDERHTEFRYDGNKFTLYSPQENFYLSKTAKTDLDKTFSDLETKYDVTIPFSNLFISDPCTRVFAEVEQVRFVGNNMVRGQKGYHLLLNGGDRNVQVWISEDKEPLILKAIITYPSLLGQPQYTAVFTDWNFNVNFSPNDFQFNPPQGATPIEFISPSNN